ncbi:MAG: aminotransferase class IV family protein [Bacteroidales bacterium]|nr:aminotransferase class IV family protein [Bacteroidales bacterium]
MCRFIETIRIEQGTIYNLVYHNRRFNETRRVFFKSRNTIDLKDYIDPSGFRDRTKCRIEYDGDELKVEYAPYRMRPVSSLRLIRNQEIQYAFKSTDRNLLSGLFDCRDGCDDILIVRNELLTDTSICNAAFYNGKEWLTPRQPLLKGTKRAELLENGSILEVDICVGDLSHFESVRLFNALIDFGEIEFPVSQIKE